MAEGGKRPKAGQEVRLADLPADAGAELGIFEQLHDFQRPDIFARHLCEASARLYGMPAGAFLDRLVQISPDELSESVGKARAEFMAKHVPEGASGQVLSVAGRFALVAASGASCASLRRAACSALAAGVWSKGLTSSSSTWRREKRSAALVREPLTCKPRARLSKARTPAAPPRTTGASRRNGNRRRGLVQVRPPAR